MTRFLVTTAVAALVSTGAIASDNEAYVNQISTTGGNSANIVQNGDGNRVGTTASGKPGPAVQDGDGNVMSIIQGGGDVAGATGSFINASAGIDQIGDDNSLTIDQSGIGGSRIFEVQQNSTGGGSNTATINQTGNMRVSRVNQTNDGSGGVNTVEITQTGRQFQQSTVGDRDGFDTETQSGIDRGVFQVGADQRVTILQDGPNNLIQTVSQSGGNGNTATLNQFGSTNFIDTVTQDGGLNTTEITLDGASNGQGSFTGKAAGVGLSMATISQTGDMNDLTYSVEGSDNLFAFSQSGNGNEIRGVVDGNANQAAVAQTGNSNTSQFDQSGNNNNIGITQSN